MIKKILLVLFLLICTACNNKQIEYIEPIHNAFLFSELENTTLKTKMLEANNNLEWDNYQFKMLNKSIPLGSFLDIDENLIDFSKYERICFEVVSVDCQLCKLQSSHIQSLLSEDVVFIQYFNDANKEEIIDFYEDKIIDNLIIIPENEVLKNYIEDELNLAMYPTLVCFNNGFVTLSCVGDINLNTFEKIKDLAFINPIDTNRLINSKGDSLLTLSREINDVKNDLSEENQLKIKELDNDNHTELMTYEILGKRVDYTYLNKTYNNTYYSDVKDFFNYQDKQVVVIYTYLNGKDDEEKINFINSLIDDRYEYLVLMAEGLESSSVNYRNYSLKFECNVASMLSTIPEELMKVSIKKYPSAIFVDKGVITGAYSNILDKENMKKATQIFLSEECVAYKSNN